MSRTPATVVARLHVGDHRPDVAVARARPSRASPVAAVDRLTERERQVLSQLARGHSDGEIAQRLGIGDAIVKTHVARLLAKLGQRDRVQMVVFAYETGIVRPGAGAQPDVRS